MKLLLIGFLLLAGCASYPTYKTVMVDTKHRAESRQIMDEASCGALNGGIDVALQQYYSACMVEKGYEFKQVKED